MILSLTCHYFHAGMDAGMEKREQKRKEKAEVSVLSRLKTPVFKAEGIPEIDEETYCLNVWGLVEREMKFTLAEIRQMPFASLDARLTSVSGWSVRARWEGVLWPDFRQQISPMPSANQVTFTSAGGYDTNIPLPELNSRVMLVWAVDGEPLERQYGGPLRLLVPHLWGYKSCKWLQNIEFHAEKRGGYWEDRGYSRSGFIEAGLTLDINTRAERPIKGGGEVTEF
jgi:DMSO/TMAO reductase YedYZ molybdopterin-dependent catalytic subunit